MAISNNTYSGELYVGTGSSPSYWTNVSFADSSQEDIFPEKVIVRDNVTTVIWKNGKKTTVRCMEGQKYSEYDAIVQAYFKYKMGSTKKRARWMNAAMKKVEHHGKRE